MLHDLICNYCGGNFQAARKDAKYCRETCRNYASRERTGKDKKNRKGKSSLSGLSLNTTQTQPTVVKVEGTPQKPSITKPVVPEQKTTPKKLTFADMPAVRGYLEQGKSPSANTSIPPAPEPPAPFEFIRPLEILPVYETYYERIPNQQYKHLSELNEKQSRTIQAQSDLVNANEKQLQQIKAAPNSVVLHYIIAGASGGLLGHELSNDRNKGAGTFWGVVGGILMMRAYHWMMDTDFEKEKQTAIQKQEKNVQLSRFYLSTYQDEQAKTKDALSRQSEIIMQERERIANTQEIENRKKEIAEYDKQKAQHYLLQQQYENALAEYQQKYGEILFSSTDEPEETAPAPLVNNPAIISGGQLLQGKGSGKLLFQGKWKTFLGEPSRDFLIAIHGPSGSGKSHFSVQFGLYLNIHHGTVLYVSGEEGHSDTMKVKLSAYANGAKMNGYDFADISNKQELFDIVPNNQYNFIILDSINNMGIDAKDLREIAEHYCCSGIVAICQNTKKGEIRGSYEVVHDCEIKIRVESGIAYTDKNRYIPDKPELEVFKIGTVPPISKTPTERTNEKATHFEEGEKLLSRRETQEPPRQKPPEAKSEPDAGLNDWNGFDFPDHIL